MSLSLDRILSLGSKSYILRLFITFSLRQTKLRNRLLLFSHFGIKVKKNLAKITEYSYCILKMFICREGIWGSLRRTASFVEHLQNEKESIIKLQKKKIK